MTLLPGGPFESYFFIVFPFFSFYAGQSRYISGLVLGQLAVLTISEIKLKHANFEVIFFMFSFAKQIKK